MKKIYLSLIAAIFAVNFSYAQWTNQSGTGNYFLNSGNVGIGTTTPNSLLSITPVAASLSNTSNIFLAGATSTLADVANSYLYPFEFQHSNSQNTDRLQFTPYRRVAGPYWMGTAYRIQFAVDNSFTDGSKAYLEIGASDPSVSGSGFIALGTNGTDRLAINGAGNVGLGTTSPVAALDVRNGAVHVIGGYGVDYSNQGAYSGWNGSGGGGETNFTNNIGGGGTGGFTFDNVSLSNVSTRLMTILGNGNVGIGTTSPQRKLDLSNSGQITFGEDVVTDSNNGLYWHSGNGYGIYRTAGSWVGGAYQQLRVQFDTGIQLGAGIGNNAGYDKSFVEIVNGKGLMVSSGNVGIGTTAPAAKLDVENGTALINTDALSALGGQLTISNNYGNLNGAVRLNFNNGGAVSWIKGVVTGANTNTGSAMAFGVPSTTSDGAEAMRITSNGSVAIGTTDPKTYMLAVAGPAIATSMTVKLQADWPDYVFKPNYTLPSLTEVKSYIDKNQHLPEMPSEQEISEKGLNLGEMNKLLVKKVEELTLYLIEKDRQLGDQQNQLKAQQVQLDASKRSSEVQSAHIQRIEDELNVVLNKIKTAQ